MRFVILPVVIIMLELLTYGFGVFLYWLMRPYVAVRLLPILITVFLLSNGLLLFGFIGHFRVSVAWLSILWMSAMALALSFAFIFLLKKAGFITPAQYFFPRALAVFSVFAMLGLSVYNAYTPIVRKLAITLDKPMPAPVTLAVASDLHMGSFVGVRELNRLEALLRAHKVDVLLMPGDIMDDDTKAFEQYQMASHLKKALNAPSTKSIATLGNHDLYRPYAYDSINRAITDAGALLLNDQVASIEVKKNGLSTRLELIGRYDDHFDGRVDTRELVKKIDPRYPVILLDHRPSQIEAHSQLPIDLQVSGHTHNGQIFPANFIVKALNKVGYGYQKINNTHFVVSSGFGFWGIPFRIGSQSEIWVIELTGTS